RPRRRRLARSATHRRRVRHRRPRHHRRRVRARLRRRRRRLLHRAEALTHPVRVSRPGLESVSRVHLPPAVLPHRARVRRRPLSSPALSASLCPLPPCARHGAPPPPALPSFPSRRSSDPVPVGVGCPAPPLTVAVSVTDVPGTTVAEFVLACVAVDDGCFTVL